jgi:hypothetical protein
MAKEDVTIKVSADMAQALQGWKQIADGPQALHGALQRVSELEQRTSKDWTSSLVRVVGQWASVTGAIALARQELNLYLQDRRRLREEENAATNTIDNLANQFYVQGRIPTSQQDQFRQQILGVSAARRTDATTGFTVGTQLVSSGLSPQQAVGGGVLDEVLALLSATNASGTGGDPRQITKALVQWMTANNLQPTRENVHGQARALQSLFAGTNLQLAELGQFAPAAATIQRFTGMAPEQSLATATQFLDLTNIERSRTSFQTAVTRLATAGANTEVQRGLGMIGVSAGDVDFQGESFEQAMQKLIAGFGGVDGAKRNAAAKLIFGQEALSFYTTITQPGALEETRRRVGLTGDEAGYQETISIAESGRGAAARQAETAAQAALFNEAALDPEVLRNRLQALMGQYGLNRTQRVNVLNAFEHPGSPLGRFFGFEDYYGPEDQAQAAAERLRFNIPGGASAREDLSQQLYRQIIGQQPLNIRLLTPDGRDVPIQVEANDLNTPFSNDATQDR